MYLIWKKNVSFLGLNKTVTFILKKSRPFSCTKKSAILFI